MRDATLMPELHENPAAACMDCIGNFSPSLCLLFVLNSRYAVPALRFLTYRGPFADNQPSAGTLSVIFDHELIRNVTRVFGSRAGEGAMTIRFLRLRSPS